MATRLAAREEVVVAHVLGVLSGSTGQRRFVDDRSCGDGHALGVALVGVGGQLHDRFGVADHSGVARQRHSRLRRSAAPACPPSTPSGLNVRYDGLGGSQTNDAASVASVAGASLRLPE